MERPGKLPTSPSQGVGILGCLCDDVNPLSSAVTVEWWRQCRLTDPRPMHTHVTDTTNRSLFFRLYPIPCQDPPPPRDLTRL